MRTRQPQLISAGSPIKIVVWDLDGTLWTGTLAERDAPVLRDPVIETIRRLDARGILHSIASRNEPATAMLHLREFGISNYFLFPQIGWNAKSISIARIATTLNIGLETVLFVDDQAFEREEVAVALPTVRVFPADSAAFLAEDPLLTPSVVTEEAGIRRLRYLENHKRLQFEESFEGPREEFLATIELRLDIFRATEDDLHRAEELVIRTNQLNSTGITYSYSELDRARHSTDHELLIVKLRDRFGDYGKIALLLLQTKPDLWTLKLLLVSCRVMSRGVGGILLSYLLGRARDARVGFQAEFRATGQNRAMQIAYKFANFRSVGNHAGITIMGHDLTSIPDLPRHVTICDRHGALIGREGT